MKYNQYYSVLSLTPPPAPDYFIFLCHHQTGLYCEKNLSARFSHQPSQHPDRCLENRHLDVAVKRERARLEVTEQRPRRLPERLPVPHDGVHVQAVNHCQRVAPTKTIVRRQPEIAGVSCQVVIQRVGARAGPIEYIAGGRAE